MPPTLRPLRYYPHGACGCSIPVRRLFLPDPTNIIIHNALRKEVKLGLFFVVVVAAAVLGYRYMRGIGLFSRTLTLYASYHDVAGLKEGDPVLISGYQIGRVEKMTYRSELTPPRIDIELRLYQKIFLPIDSRARIANTDILGNKAVVLIPGKAAEGLDNKDTITGEVEESFQETLNRTIEPLKQRTVALMAELDTVVIAVKSVLNTETVGALRHAIQRLTVSIQRIDRMISSVDTAVQHGSNDAQQTLANLRRITQSIEQNRAQLAHSIAALSAVSDSLQQAPIKSMIDSLYATVTHARSVMAKIDRGQGTAGLLINDSGAYVRLEQSLDALEKLLTDMRRQPYRYVHFSIFGRGRKK